MDGFVLGDSQRAGLVVAEVVRVYVSAEFVWQCAEVVHGADGRDGLSFGERF